jgi:hypothetical protein
LLFTCLVGRCAAQAPVTDFCPTQPEPSVYAAENVFHTRSLIRAGNLDKALTYAQQQATDKPTSAAAQVALGEAQLANSNAAASIAAFNQALKLDPCNAIAHYNAWRLQSLASSAPAPQHQLDLAHQLDPTDTTISRTWTAVHHSLDLAESPNFPVVKSINPPLNHFFAKTLDCDGIPVRSSAAVHDTAIILGCGKIRILLAHLPDARKRLHNAGAELHILRECEHTSDLPENRHFKTEPYIDAEGKSTSVDQRTRGVGGLQASCGEENLLYLPADRYSDGSDICTHEFSHALRNHGLSGKQRAAADAQYSASLKAGLWKNAYASVNADEFFAEITMWYFGTHGQFVPGNLTTPGPEALKAYDPAAFALLESIYGPLN